MLLSSSHSGTFQKLVCVEPSEGMREGFENRLKEERGKGSLDDEVEVKCVEGLFDSIPVEDASADLVVVGQVSCFCDPSCGG